MYFIYSSVEFVIFLLKFFFSLALNGNNQNVAPMKAVLRVRRKHKHGQHIPVAALTLQMLLALIVRVKQH